MPGTRKKSVAGKKLSGTYRASRDNKSTPVPDGVLGPAPDFMTDTEKSVWEEIADRIPEGVATNADRIAFEILVRLMVKFRSGEITGTETTALMRLLQQFGATPLTRDSVSVVPTEIKGNKWARGK